MKKFIIKIWDAITYPFIAIAVLIDYSRRINEDCSWDSYWTKKNKKETNK